MPSCFVVARPVNTKSENGLSDCWSAYRNILAALRIGFNYEDLRHMTMREFIAYTDLAFSTDGAKQTKDASQKDIDAFLA